MKYLLKKIAIATILVFSVSTFSQETNTDDEIIHNFGTMRSYDGRSKKLVGSSYINKEFLPAKLSGSETIYSVRYNAHLDEMEVSKDGKEYGLQKKFNFPVTFIGINKIYQVFEYDNKGIKKGYFVMLNKGEKITLLLKEEIKFVAEVEAKTGYDEYQPPKLIRAKDKLYIGYINNTTKTLPKKKSEFYALFSSNAKTIEKYVKGNKLSYKNKEDLVKIFTHYNGLK